VRPQLVTIALSHAPRDDEATPRFASLAEGEHRVDALATRILDEGAGVHDDDVGGGVIVGFDEPLAAQNADEFVRIHLVLRTAESLDIERPGHDR
jgi:hypothetical protein